VQGWMRVLGLAPKRQRSKPSDALVTRVLAGSMASTAATASLPAPKRDKGCGGQTANTVAAESALVQCMARAEGEGIGEAQRPNGVLAPASASPSAAAAAASAAGAADAALAALRGGSHHADAARKAGTVTVVEKRRFAGQDVEISRELRAGTKQAEAMQRKAAAAAGTGIDAVLHNIQGAVCSVIGRMSNGPHWLYPGCSIQPT
jgi:hypothetical protein